MRIFSISVFLGAVIASTSASAQSEATIRACESGDDVVCSRMYFGNCAHENPRVAIPACTRQLSQLGQQDQRAVNPSTRRMNSLRYAMRANAHLKDGNLENALADFDRAITSSDDYFWVHERRGRAYFIAGDYEEAMSSFNEAAALNPDDATLL
ncbi:MAG: tetratricopeptide repeat protein, partial [Burkholderiales bacterium]|nr:tetratricopeptide repeat protein [Burkholderiales bacterium]